MRQTGIILKERLNTYMQHIQQHKLRQIDVERQIRTCDGENFKSTPFFATKDNKILRIIQAMFY